MGVGAIGYVGSHGAEVMPAGAKRPTLMDAFASWQGRVRRFVRAREERADLSCCASASRTRARSTPSTGAARPTRPPPRPGSPAWPRRPRPRASTIHWGRKVLEIRPPVPVDKGQGIVALVEPLRCHRGPLRRRRRDRPGRLRRARRAGGRRPPRTRREGRRAFGRGAGGDRRPRRPRGGRRVAASPACSPIWRAEVHRLPPRVGAAVRRRRQRRSRWWPSPARSADDDTFAIAVAVGWWALAAAGGLWLGRRMAPTTGIEPPARRARAPRTPCPSSSRAPCSSTASGRWPCSRSSAGARGVPVPADPGHRRGLRDRRGAHVAEAVERRSRRSRTATACASSSTAARPSASPSCCAPRGRGRSSRRRRPRRRRLGH